MLLIGLREFALSCSSAFFGLCFRCASVNALFCRAKPPNASFFSIFTRALARGVLLNRRCASVQEPDFKMHKSNELFLNILPKEQRNRPAQPAGSDAIACVDHEF